MGLKNDRKMPPEGRIPTSAASDTVKLPFVVDLDGTLILQDMTFLGIKDFLTRFPLKAYKLLFWFLKGRAYLKENLVKHVPCPSYKASLNQPFYAYLKKLHQLNYEVILATGTHISWAQQIARDLKIFSHVLGTNNQLNLTSTRKANALNTLYGKGNYIYAGNSRNDLPVWKCAKEIIVVNAPKGVLKRASRIKDPIKIF